MAKLPIAVFLSGRGSNFQAILRAIQKGTLQAEIKVVISDNPEAKGVGIAQEAGIFTWAQKISSFASKAEYEAAILAVLQEQKIDLIVLAGYMKLVGDTLLAAYWGRIMNLHPSLLPAFKGLNTHKRALDFGVKFVGCTVHFIDQSLDEGYIIDQAIVPVDPADTEDTLTEKVLKEEHQLLPQCIQWYAERRLEIQGKKVVLKEATHARAY